ncbi:sugar kinase [Microbacterium resistens]|uniref:sugar kinase n=1 Tax=Microbacterium resistens TaxID=156977 RepID=UPI001C5635C5|nr:sugar kinase [Microbacterium resistens]MBW1638469.1 sugar kinase [Microbacterium resistens]
MTHVRESSGAVVTFGEAMGLATSSQVGSMLHERVLGLSFGGAEANVAIGLSRLGVPSVWMSRLGDDSLGRLIRREMSAENVSVIARVDDNAPTGFMLKERLGGDRTNVFFYRAGSAASRMSPEDLDARAVRNAALLHITGIAPALSASARATTERAVHIAKEAGTPISFDLNYRAKLWTRGEAAAVFRSLIPDSEIVFAGENEARILFPDVASAADLPRALVDLGSRRAVIKQGAEGCTAFIDGEILKVPAVAVKPIDTVGAGDAFVAGFLSQFLGGARPLECLERAVITGAMACLVAGDWEGAAFLEELG